MKTTRLMLTAAALVLSFPSFGGPPVYSLLEKARPFIMFPDYTLEQKKLVLEQTKLIVNDVYVHRDLKIKTFGADPAPKFQYLEQNLATIQTADFHIMLSDLFNAFRDRHTLYKFPKPVSCYETILPFYVREVTDESGLKVIAINDLVSNDEVSRLIGPSKIKRGDVIISYDGMPVEEVILKGYSGSNGANVAASRHLSIAGLRFREMDLQLPPPANTVKLVLKNRQGKIYSEEVPWIVKKDWSCLAQSAAPAEEDNNVFYWKVLENEHGTFGYLNIPTFESEKTDYWVERFKIIVRDEFKNTDGLIIDTRFNGGGNSGIAEKMVQLFTPKYVKPQLDILKATNASLHFLKTSNPNDPFTIETLLAQKNGDTFTRPLPLNSEAQMNAIGQFYFKPVAVFTDGYCYSSCDMFAAHMQDIEAATIFGERENTGGGGGNVFTMTSFMGFMNGNFGPFKALPNGQDMWFAFRQTIRSGKNAGKLIENDGIKSDIINFPTITDIFMGDAPQLNKIGKYLADKSGDYTSEVTMSEARQDYEIGATPSVELSWQDTSAIQFTENGKVIGASNISNSSEGTILLIPADTSKIRPGRLDLIGSFNDKDVWRKVLNYRIIPQSKPINAPVVFTTKDFALYTLSSDLSDGWQISGNQLKLGSTTGYQDDVNAEASLFVTPKNAMTLSFKADINTEKDCDFFKVLIIADGEEFEAVAKLSGTIPLKEYKVNLSNYAGKKIEIRFKFDSDSGTIAKGVTLKDIGVSKSL